MSGDIHSVTLHATLERQIDTEVFYGGHAPTPAKGDVRAFER